MCEPEKNKKALKDLQSLNIVYRFCGGESFTPCNRCDLKPLV